MTQSIQSRIVAIVIRLMRIKQQLPWQDSEQKSARAKPSDAMSLKYRVSSRVVEGRNVWTIAPKNAASNSNSSHQHVFFVHGGTYVQSLDPLHWAFMTKLIDRIGCTVIAPDYPLAPTHQAPKLEEPLPADDLSGHVQLAKSTSLRIAVGESM